MNTYTHSRINTLYNIAIKTTIGLTTFEFENTLTLNRIPKLNLNEIKDIKKLVDQHRLTHCVIHYEHDFKVIKIKDLKEEDVIVPVFITSDSLIRGGDIPLRGNIVRPILDEENLSVYIGNSKLFSLPYWRCKQVNNMTIEKDFDIKFVPISNFLIGSHLERYLNNKLSKHRDFERVTDIGEKEYFYYLDEIQKHKIYDIDWSNLIRIENKDVMKVICNNSTLQKTYEKKFLSDHNIYLQKKKEKNTKKELDEKRKTKTDIKSSLDIELMDYDSEEDILDLGEGFFKKKRRE